MSCGTLRRINLGRVPTSRTLLRGLYLALCTALTGCAAVTNPVANGVPVRLVPPELLGESKSSLESIPLTSLRQPPPEAYVLEPNDLLAVWIEGVLGEKGQAPPVRYGESGNLPPALGYPIPVRADGTINLPFVPPIKVQGMTLEQAEAAIRKAYTVDRQIILPGRERIFVSLMQPRRYHVLVIREDGAIDGGSGSGIGAQRTTGFVVGVGAQGSPGVRRGKGYALDLPAYENDLLNALALTGGFPGSDAANEIIVERGSFRGSQGREDLVQKMQACLPGSAVASSSGGPILRIPLRVRPGERSPLPPEAITLQTGDTVYIQARPSEVFYTGGLLPPGEFLLPRDVDLDVIEAIARVGGPINSGGFSAANISGSALTQGGNSSIGGPSPSLLTVLRQTPNGKQLAIRVDLNRAMRDPRERITVQPKDILLLQETPQEAMTRYASRVFNLNIVYKLIDSSRAKVTGTANLP